ncbi:dynein axonemal heavy chain 9-like [Gavia stellata]|uniref:dynein axonemal heavy chain 9-like n=1 Tax=Gavia stellata TaxID=37040 RepID=UPI00289C4141|nr:dynein axonemal heavy chain 9-like [Gavia stellata]
MRGARQQHGGALGAETAGGSGGSTEDSVVGSPPGMLFTHLAQGELTMTSDVENLQNALLLDTVPESWIKRAHPSTASLGTWFADLLTRVKELEAWTGDFSLPSSVWLAGFFNPQSVLTAIMQSTARKNEWPLDKMALQRDVTKKNREDFASPPREGAYVQEWERCERRALLCSLEWVSRVVR